MTSIESAMQLHSNSNFFGGIKDKVPNDLNPVSIFNNITTAKGVGNTKAGKEIEENAGKALKTVGDYFSPGLIDIVKKSGKGVGDTPIGKEIENGAKNALKSAGDIVTPGLIDLFKKIF